MHIKNYISNPVWKKTKKYTTWWVQIKWYIFFLAFLITFLKIHYEWPSIIKRKAHKQGWMIQYLKKKNPSNYTFTTAGFPLSPQKGIAHKWDVKYLDTLFIIKLTSCSYWVTIVPAFKVHAFLILLKMLWNSICMKQTIKKIMHESLHAKHGQSETFINSKKHWGRGGEWGTTHLD